MKMNHDRVDKILQLGWLEGWINTRGAYERAVVKRKVRPEPSRQALVRRLELMLTEARPASPLTVGVLLRGVRAEHVLRSPQMFSRLGVSKNIYRMMEQDTISPLKISAGVWKKLMKLLNYPADELAGILRRTEQLVLYRPSFKGVLARYSSGKRGGLKRSSLEKANAELYAKATLPLPEDQEEKLKNLIGLLKAGEE